MMHKVDLTDTPYMGTLMRYPDSTENIKCHRTPRENRGRAKVNKRKPRNVTRAMSDTLVTKLDGTQTIIPRKKPRAIGTKRRQKIAAQQRTIEAARTYAQLTFDQKHRQDYI
jgi:hypothetical protein